MFAKALPLSSIVGVLLLTIAPSAGSAGAQDRAPAPAAAVGYLIRTAGPEVILLRNTYKFNFLGVDPKVIRVSQNADGSLIVLGPEGDDYGAQLCTAQYDSSTRGWSGMAFGGGGYFEATMSFSKAYNGPGPTFWANDIETMGSRSAGNKNIQWPGQPAGFGNWIEADVVEFNASGQAYGIAMHNWYGTHESTQDVNTGPILGSPISTPPGTDFSKPHKYGLLWVPAMPPEKGYAKWFFDDIQVGKTLTWDAYVPSASPPPVMGSSAFSVIDARHLALILGTGSNPVTIYAVAVWQRTASQNLTSNVRR
jgi:hypothetical protein